MGYNGQEWAQTRGDMAGTTQISTAWRNTVTARLDHLRALPAGWDGYDGRAVEASIASYALALLDAVARPGTPAPSLVPGSSGDLQIEWHTRDWDLEIDIARPGAGDVWRRNAVTGVEEQVSLGNDLDTLRAWIAEVEEPARAAHPAAT